MRRIGFFGALALLVVVNAMVLTGVAWNRTGEPEATLRLTERELPVHFSYHDLGEDSGRTLRLGLFEGDTSPDWLDADKLRTLGFHPEHYLTADDTVGAFYKRPPPRDAWVALAFEGPAWEGEIAAREQEVLELAEKIGKGEATNSQLVHRQQELERLRLGASRLVAVDVGLDTVALRERYADTSRYLIVSAELRMGIMRSSDPDIDEGDERVRGIITEILTSRIHVPPQHRAALEAALGTEGTVESRRREAGPPRYEVLVKWGARYEPWIAEINALKQ